MNQYLDPQWWQQTGLDLYEKLVGWFTSPQFYAQVGAIIACVIAAWFIARLLKQRVSWFAVAPTEGVQWYRIRQYVYALSDLLFPLLCYVLLGFAVDIVQSTVGASWLVKIARGASVVFLLYSAINRFISQSDFSKRLCSISASPSPRCRCLNISMNS